MKTIQYGQKISVKELTAEIDQDSQTVSYRVMGLGFYDFVNKDMGRLNEMFLDDCVDMGNLLMDVSYKFVQDKLNVVGVEVHVADVSEFVNPENH